MGGCREVTSGTFPELFFLSFFSPPPCFSEWVVGRDSLQVTHSSSPPQLSHIVHLSNKTQDSWKKAAHSVSKFSRGRRAFLFVCGAFQSFKLFKRYSFLTGFPLRVPLFYWILVSILFVEPETLTSLHLLDFYCCVCSSEAILLFTFLAMRSSFMQVKPVATQQCSVSVSKRTLVFVHGVLLVFTSVLDIGWIV